MTKEKAEDHERGFTVVDKRARAEPEPASRSEAEELPRVDFSGFCLSLGTSALYHLGFVGDPESGDRVAEPNLAAARQTIDALEVLEKKTAGNLDDGEAELLKGLLYELRMRFVEAGQKAGGNGGQGSA